MPGISTQILCSLLFSFFSISILHGQQIAFPGAQGAGQFTSGGRGTPTAPTTVFEVTRIDDPSPTVAGTLRHALSQSTTTYPHRTIVFRVSGTIRLTSRLTIPRNTTIAGQTAPGDGICLADRPVVINGDNVIVRFIRIRMGDKYQNNGLNESSGADDAFGDLGHKNIIVDHCSISWSADEACTIYRGDSVTLQYNIISEPLNANYHWETGSGYQEHGYSGIWGARHASFHHNLLTHAKGRMPRFAGNSTYSLPDSIEKADFRNNVIYHWLSYSTNGGEGGHYNLVNNYYKSGPNTSTGSSAGVPVRVMIMNPSKSSSLPYPKLFVSGNRVDDVNATNTNLVNNNNWRGIAFASGSLNDSTNSKVTQPFNIGPVPTTETALEAYEIVLRNAGATLPKRDTLDERIVENVRNRTGRVIDKQGGYPRDTPFEQTLNAWPTLNTAPPPTDTDKDGMPDEWETANGLNPNNAADRSIVGSDGYTMLEKYLNGIVEQAVLPLKLLSFNGSIQQKQVTLFWTTADQVKINDFVVEKSVDGTTFKPVATIPVINASNTLSYNYKDDKAVEGKVFYRLRINDKDSRFAYSGIISFNSSLKATLGIYPNPAVDNLVVTHSKAAVGTQLVILSVDGKRKLVQQVVAGSEQTSFSINMLPSGQYALQLISGSTITTKQFQK